MKPFFQSINNFFKYWKPTIAILIIVITGIPSGTWFIFGKYLELTETITQKKNTIGNLSREIERLQISKEIIEEKDDEIEKLKKELSTDRGQSECCKIILAQIDKTNKKIDLVENDINFGLFNKIKTKISTLEKYRDQLEQRLRALNNNLVACKK